MYYTDLAAVIAVLISWSYALEQRYVLSALVRSPPPSPRAAFATERSRTIPSRRSALRASSSVRPTSSGSCSSQAKQPSRRSSVRRTRTRSLIHFSPTLSQVRALSSFELVLSIELTLTSNVTQPTSSARPGPSPARRSRTQKRSDPSSARTCPSSASRRRSSSGTTVSCSVRRVPLPLSVPARAEPVEPASSRAPSPHSSCASLPLARSSQRAPRLDVELILTLRPSTHLPRARRRQVEPRPDRARPAALLLRRLHGRLLRAAPRRDQGAQAGDEDAVRQCQVRLLPSALESSRAREEARAHTDSSPLQEGRSDNGRAGGNVLEHQEVHVRRRALLPLGVPAPSPPSHPCPCSA